MEAVQPEVWQWSFTTGPLLGLAITKAFPLEPVKVPVALKLVVPLLETDDDVLEDAEA
jgi:hypothetical protein